MRISIQTSDFELGDHFRSFIEQTVRSKISPVEEHIQSVLVVLKDNNGPKGGRDQECTVEVVVPNLPSIVVKKRSSEMAASVRKATGRAARAANRQLKKRLHRKKEHLTPLFNDQAQTV